MGPATPSDEARAREERIRAFEEFVREDPNDAVAHFSLGQALFAARRFDEAAAAFERAIALSPAYSAAYRGLGRAHDGAGRRDAAERAFTRGIEVACAAGDLQTQREMEVFLARLRANDARA